MATAREIELRRERARRQLRVEATAKVLRGLFRADPGGWVAAAEVRRQLHLFMGGAAPSAGFVAAAMMEAGGIPRSRGNRRGYAGVRPRADTETLRARIAKAWDRRLADDDLAVVKDADNHVSDLIRLRTSPYDVTQPASVRDATRALVFEVDQTRRCYSVMQEYLHTHDWSKDGELDRHVIERYCEGVRTAVIAVELGTVSDVVTRIVTRHRLRAGLRG